MGAADAQLSPLLVVSHLRWDFVWQRPQHLLTRAAKEAPVYFLEEPFYNDEFEGKKTPLLEQMPREGGRVLVLRPQLPVGTDAVEVPGLVSKLATQFLAERNADKYILWAYTPAAVELLPGLLTPKTVVFDVMDELSAFKGASPALLDQERRMLAAADVVFTGGLSLFEAKQGRHHNIYCHPSSIEGSHFAQARTIAELPVEYAEMPRPRLGFYGVIDERFDIDLLGAVAALRPEWQWVMIGPIVKIDPAALPQAENIHYLGGRTYTELPAHLAAWDVALLPFALNESTKYISPTKTPEYLAAGKPTVSTPITDVIRPYGELGLVHIAHTPEAFVAACEAALAQIDDADWLARTDDHLATNSWDETWRQMRQQILSSNSEIRMQKSDTIVLGFV